MTGAYTYDFETALKEVTEKYGAERVKAIIAHNVNQHNFDGRLTTRNKDWAGGVETPKSEYIRLNTHLAVFDGFVSFVRKAYELEQAQTAPTLAELEKSVNNGESISVMDLANAVKNERLSEQKPSIIARIEADKREKAASEKRELTAEKTKKTEIDI